MTGQVHTLPFPRAASLIGGIALPLVAVLAGVSNVGILSSLIESGDAVKTAHDIADSEALFRLRVLLIVIAAVLDVVVAAALLVLSGPVNRAVAVTAPGSGSRTAPSSSSLSPSSLSCRACSINRTASLAASPRNTSSGT